MGHANSFTRTAILIMLGAYINAAFPESQKNIEPLAECVIYFFVLPEVCILLPRRETGFRLNTLPE
jgi:hypothetical protein